MQRGEGAHRGAVGAASAEGSGEEWNLDGDDKDDNPVELPAPSPPLLGGFTCGGGRGCISQRRGRGNRGGGRKR